MQDKMIMTKVLADQLFETLMCIALSAMGGVDPDNLNEEQIALAENYAKENFALILEQWEDATGKQWDIEVEVA